MSCDWFEREGLLLLERGERPGDHLSACPRCGEAARAHDRLKRAVERVGAAATPAPDWQAKVWRSIATAGSRRRLRLARGWLALPAVAAAVVALLFVVPGPDDLGSPRLELDAVASAGAPRRGQSYQPGDTLRMRAAGLGPAPAELRLYREDNELLLSCSDAPPCVREGDELVAAHVLAAPGKYQVVLVASGSGVPAPRGQLDTDAAAAMNAGARVVLGEVDVW